MVNHAQDHRSLLRDIARRAMRDRGLETDFTPAALAEVGGLTDRTPSPADARDLRALAWCSIDNDDSRDLDQLTVAVPADNGRARILVAVADVDVLVPDGCAVDAHARQNTTSVYTAAEIFPMLPERLSTDLTSLNADVDRAAIVVDVKVGSDGSVEAGDVYRALVRNQAKLAYNSVGAWLEDRGPMPPPLVAVPAVADQLKLQDAIAQRLKRFRHEHGALDLETIEARPVFEGDRLDTVRPEMQDRAKDLIEDFMIAANGVTARFLDARGFPSIRRVVRAPERWDRIVELAREHGAALPPEPDPVALEHFLVQRRAADPLRFPDLSLTIIKLMGAGEYVLERPGAGGPGHFGLAVSDYGHSTAPNRRYPDLITQRLLKASLAARPCPYTDDELNALARHCTEQEDDAKKVERLVRKAAAALMLDSHIGDLFDGVVTGASPKGTWVRILHPPVEGRVVAGFQGLDVGDRVQVKLVHTDVERGFIDFERAHDGSY